MPTRSGSGVCGSTFRFRSGFTSRVGIDVVELRLVFAFSSPSSRTTTRGVFTSPDSMASFKPEVAHDPPKQRLFAALASRRGERRRRQVVAHQNSARAVNAVKPANPLGGFLQFVFGKSRNLHFRRYAPSVVGFVVDHENVFCGVHLAQHFAHISLVAQCVRVCPRCVAC